MPLVLSACANNEPSELILLMALQFFAQKGFDAATMHEISTAADVNHGQIPYSFGTTGKLWEESVDLAFGNMAAGLEFKERGRGEGPVVDLCSHLGAREFAAGDAVCGAQVPYPVKESFLPSSRTS